MDPNPAINEISIIDPVNLPDPNITLPERVALLEEEFNNQQNYYG